MRRRAVLAALAEAGALAGCSSLVRPSGGASRDTLTPALVGTDGGRDATTATPASCPELPTNAEVYLCSETAAEGLQLRPATDRAAGRTSLRLDNPTSIPFNTGTDWWTLAERLPGTENDDWGIVAQGDGTGRLRLGTDESFTWVFGPPATTVATDAEARTTRVGARPASGRYAFSIVGYFGGGELTAVIAPFAVRPGD